MATAASNVTVEDTVPPTVQTQDMTVQLNATGNAVIAATEIDFGSTDACGIVSFDVDQSAFNGSHLGANNVTLTVADSNGNTSSETATVTVADGIAPIAMAQDITVVLDANGNATLTPAEIDDGSSDNVEIATRTLDKTTFTLADLGDNTVTLTVADTSGNTSTATATVTLLDAAKVDNVRIDDGTLQRSMVRSIRVTFNRVVDLASGAFELTRSDGTNVGLDDYEPDHSTGKTVVTLTFSGVDILGGSLADGNYSLRIRADRVSVADTQMSADHVDDFFRHYGDIDGDRDVDAADLFWLRRSYRTAAPGDKFNPAFDIDGDNDVDAVELFFFRQRYRTRLNPNAPQDGPDTP